MKQLFLTSSANVVLADIVKYLPLRPSEYNFAFITTAAETKEGEHPWVTSDKNKMIELGFNIDEFSITDMDLVSLEEKMKNKNGIFVCGGNPLYLLDQMIKTGFEKILLDKIENGTIYIGSSAGSMIFGNNLDLLNTLDLKTKVLDLKSDGLNTIDLNIFPHWGTKDMRDIYYNGFDILYNKENLKLIFLQDNQYIHFNGDNYVINQVN